MNIGPVGLKLIEWFEGLRLQAYRNPGDVWTIGYGTTAGAGVDVHEGMTCTKEQAEDWLRDYVDGSVLPELDAAAKAGYRSFNQNQVDALASFGYNLGAGIFGVGYSIGRDIRNGSVPVIEIANILLLYDDPGSIYQHGLLTRRETERALFIRPIGAPNPEGI